MERLHCGLGSLLDLVERLDSAQDDRERRSVLLVMVTAAVAVRDRSADAYAALDLERDADGIAKGVLE